MPLLAYFSVVGSLLLGLLYVAEAQLGPPKSLSVSTNFHGVPQPWKAHVRTPVLTARDVPAPIVTATQSTTQSSVATQPAAATQSTVVNSQSKVEPASSEQKPTRVAGKSKGKQKTPQQKTAQQQPTGASWPLPVTANQQQTTPQQKKNTQRQKTTQKTARNNGNSNVFAHSGASRPASGFVW